MLQPGVVEHFECLVVDDFNALFDVKDNEILNLNMAMICVTVTGDCATYDAIESSRYVTRQLLPLIKHHRQ